MRALQGQRVARRLLSELCPSGLWCQSHYATTAATSQATSPAEDWTTTVRASFSIRPSLLSPLYAQYASEQQRCQRRQLIMRLLEAHTVLATEVDAVDPSQIEVTARQRADSLRGLAKELQSLLPRGNLVTCQDRGLMLGYYTMLEEQVSRPRQPLDLAASQDMSGLSALPAQPPAQAAEEEDDAEAYHRLVKGQVDVWQMWQQRFVNRYAGTPCLEPLEDIYATSSAGAAASSRTSSALALASSSGSGSGSGRVKTSRQLRLGRTDATIDMAGTVCAVGRRKSALAKVMLRRGSGTIRVNGQPYDAYFQDLAVRAHLLKPLLALPYAHNKFDIKVLVTKGGAPAQAQAASTAIAKAMLFYVKRGSKVLHSLAITDPRVRERMKPGRRGAKAGYTWVKR
ncbi:ribosomal protein S9/S16-domain-containing protein [Haematococcus lacustris]